MMPSSPPLKRWSQPSALMAANHLHQPPNSHGESNPAWFENSNQIALTSHELPFYNEGYFSLKISVFAPFPCYYGGRAGVRGMILTFSLYQYKASIRAVVNLFCT